MMVTGLNLIGSGDAMEQTLSKTRVKEKGQARSLSKRLLYADHNVSIHPLFPVIHSQLFKSTVL